MNTYRYLARLVIETTTPIAISSGDKDIITDKLIMTDVNGLPYIPGTSIAGVLRGMCEGTNLDSLFGATSNGSKIIVSSALLVGHDGSIVEGLVNLHDPFYERLKQLPIRQHVKIGANGAAKKNSLFNEQIVYAGTRFCFEIELHDEKNDDNTQKINQILNLFYSSSFRIGGGTRSGFGRISVVECKQAEIETTNLKYIDKTSSLNDPFWVNVASSFDQDATLDDLKPYTSFELHPEHFFCMGEIPLLEDQIKWEDRKPRFSMQEYAVIPGSSIKGALSHRTAFYYNLANNVSLESISRNGGKFSQYVEKENNTIKELFGSEEIIGKVLIDDSFLEIVNLPLFKQTRIAIDAYSGGTISGALFPKQQINKCNLKLPKIKVEVYLDRECSDESKKALNLAIDDLKNGHLQIGSNTTIGLGVMINKV